MGTVSVRFLELPTSGYHTKDSGEACLSALCKIQLLKKISFKTEEVLAGDQKKKSSQDSLTL